MNRPRTSRALAHAVLLFASSLALASFARAATERPNPPSAPAPPAARFGSGGQWVLGLDGIATFGQQTFADQHSSYPDEQGHLVETTFGGSSSYASFFAPRPGVDWFFVPHVSVGLGASFNQQRYRFENRIEGPGGGASSSTQTSMSVRAAPRVGAAWTSASGLGVWARAAFEETTGWERSSQSGGNGSVIGLAGNDATRWTVGLSVGLEALVTYTPRSNVVLLAGPWFTQHVATFRDASQEGIAPQPSPPPAFGITVGAGLFL